MQPFTISIPQGDLDNLNWHLAHTRWPDEQDTPWTAGASLDYMRELVRYWCAGYDWRAEEAKLNKTPQYRMMIDDMYLHFMHIQSNNPQATPLLLIHGWPDSFFRFHKVIPLLSDQFHVVVPSIPGFGFSERKTLGPKVVGGLFARLMESLDYDRFVVSSGDIGTNIVRTLALQAPQAVIAMHLTDVGYPTGQEVNLAQTELEFLAQVRQWSTRDGGYLVMQATKPQTLAYGLNDSPVGLAAWIVSMIASQAHNNEIDAAFGGRDSLLTNIMIYWLTQTVGSAALMYRRIMTEMQAPAAAKPSAPAHVTIYPRELVPPRAWADRNFTIQDYRIMPRGGHFAALEEPQLFAASLQQLAQRRPRWMV